MNRVVASWIQEMVEGSERFFDGQEFCLQIPVNLNSCVAAVFSHDVFPEDLNTGLNAVDR